MFLSIFNIFLEILFPTFAVIGVGAAIDKKLRMDPHHLSSLSMNLLFPAFIIHYLSRLEVQPKEIGAIIIMAVGSTLLLWVLGLILVRIIGLKEKLRASFILCLFYGNVGTLGFTIIGFAYGDPGFQRAALFYAVVQLFVNPLAIFIASRGSATLKESMMNVVKNPIIYALLIGVLLNVTGVILPLPIDRCISLIAKAAIPTQLILLGFQLARVSFKKQFGLVLLTSGIRLIAAPAVGFALAALTGIQGQAMQASMLQISMPTGLFVTVYATEYDADPEFTSMVGMMTTIGSIITLSLLLTIL